MRTGRGDGEAGARRRIARRLVQATIIVMRGLTRLLGERTSVGGAQLNEAELLELVAHSQVLDRHERRLIAEVIAAGDRHVRELMVPRTEVDFLEAGLSIGEAVARVRASRHSRFPVIDSDADDVIGFVHVRDLLLRPTAEARDRELTIRAIARPVHQLPVSKPVLAALSEMRRAGHQLALVVDEYGGTAGVVTLEDLIEELIGEIHDEYDATPEPAAPEGVTPAEVDGLLNLSDFAELVGFELTPGPYDTVGGFMMAALGRLPRQGDEVVVADRWRLHVAAMDGRRVARVALARASNTDLAELATPPGLAGVADRRGSAAALEPVDAA